MTSAPPQPPRVSVIGLGNVFLGDDGFGPTVVEMFRCQYEWESNVEIIDLGTPGLDLAPYIAGRDLVVLIDAVHANAPPGTLSVYCEADFSTPRAPAQSRLTGHDPGLWESLAHMRLAGCAPAEFVIIGVVPGPCDFGAHVSPAVGSASVAAVEAIAIELGRRGVDCRRRLITTEPNLWWLPLPVTPVPCSVVDRLASEHDGRSHA